MILVYLRRWSYGRFQDDNNIFYKMKNDLTTGTWQDDIWCPIIIILFCTSDDRRCGCHCCRFCHSMTRGGTTNSRGGREMSAPDKKRGTIRGGGVTRSGQLEHWHWRWRWHQRWCQCRHQHQCWLRRWHRCCYHHHFYLCRCFRCVAGDKEGKVGKAMVMATRMVGKQQQWWRQQGGWQRQGRGGGWGKGQGWRWQEQWWWQQRSQCQGKGWWQATMMLITMTIQWQWHKQWQEPRQQRNEDNDVDDNADAVVWTNLVGALFQWWEGGLVWQDCQRLEYLCHLSSWIHKHKVIVGVGHCANWLAISVS